MREAGDLSAGVFDRRGYMVAQAVTGTPGHINSMALAMKHFLAACPLETLRPGDVLTFPQGPHIRVVRVLDVGKRRGPAPEARTLYDDLAPMEPRASQAAGPAEAPPGAAEQRPRGAGRPTKAERRAIDKLKREDEGG